MSYSAIGLQSPIGLQDTRNVLINGEFNLWQRGITSSIGFTGGGNIQNQYCADRWRYYAQTSSTGNGSTAPDVQISRVNFGLGEPSGAVNSSKYYLNIFFGHTADLTGTPFTAPENAEPHGGFSGGTGEGNFLALVQDIEDVNTLAGKSAILSFWAKSDFASQVIIPRLKQYFGKDASIGSNSVNYIGTTGARHTIDNTWRQYKTEFNISGVNGKVLGTSGDHALQLSLLFHRCRGHGLGGGFAGTTMELGNGTGLTGNISIAQVQLEQGTNATEFDTKHPSVEIAQCKRYYDKSYDLDVTPGAFVASYTTDAVDADGGGWITIHFGNAENGHLFGKQTEFAVPMRSRPTCTIYHPFDNNKSGYFAHSNANGGGGAGGGGSEVGTVETSQKGIEKIEALTFAPTANMCWYHYTADAELNVETADS